MFKWKSFDVEKKKKTLKDIKLNEISLVDKPANGVPFLIVKSESGEQLSSLEELLSVEEFNETEIEKVEAALQQLSFLDDDSSDAIGNLILAVATNPKLAKSCEQESWPSITGKCDDDVVELDCLIEKNDLNEVEQYFQKFVIGKSVSEDNFELAIIDNALEIISDLDEDSLSAIHNLLKVDWSNKGLLWPSIIARGSADNDSDDEPVKKDSNLNWPSFAVDDGTVADDAEDGDFDFEYSYEKSNILWPSFGVN